jgi:hypothetical protein
LALSLLSGSVTLNVFTHLQDYTLINSAIENIPEDIKIRIWVRDNFDKTKLRRSCEVFFVPAINLSWVQKMRMCARLAREAQEAWFGYAHDDATISREDFSKMLEARKTAGDNIYWIVTNNPKHPEINADVYALINTKNYWAIGGHDEGFHIYYADIDFHIRQAHNGKSQLGVCTPSTTHIGSAVLKRLEGLEAELYKLQLKKDHAYFKLKHPSFDV